MAPIIWHVLTMLLLSSVPACAFLRSLKQVPITNNSPFVASVQGDFIISTVHVDTDAYLHVEFISFNNDSDDFATMRYDEPQPDYLIPLVGLSPSALCISGSGLSTPNFPCAMLGFFMNSTKQMWLALNNLSTGIATKVQIDTLTLPFECSEALPCVIRTADPTAGEVGGCDMGGAAGLNGLEYSDTLVVVMWNRSRYFWKPLLHLAGAGTGVRKVPNSWPSAQYDELAYDAGLHFGLAPSQTSLYVSACVMCLMHMNGTVELYSLGSEDNTSPTGMLRVAALVPPAPTFVAVCLPTVQFLIPPFLSYSLLSVTCANGMGWMWDLGLSITLVGAFNLPPPPSVAPGQPLVVDISILQVSVPTDVLGLLTTVALLGTGYLNPIPRLPNVVTDPRYISLAVFRSIARSDTKLGWITQELLTSTVASGQFLIEGGVQYLRNGIGWVLPKAAPAYVDYAETGDATSICNATLSWLASVAFYGAVSTDYHLLISATTGTLATPSELVMANQILLGGARFNGPTYVGNTTVSFTRMPNSPIRPAVIYLAPSSAVLQSNGPGESSALYQLSFGTSAFLELSVNYVTHSTSDQSWHWVGFSGYPAAQFSPTPISLQLALPVPFANTASLQWMHNTPVMYSTDLASRTATVLIGASAADFPASVGASCRKPVSHVTINTLAAPYLFVCHGELLTSYTTSIGYSLWTFNLSSGAYCSSGNCGCTANSSVFAPPIDRDPVVVVFQDIVLGTSGVVVIDFELGFLIAYYESGHSLASKPVLNECGPIKTLGTALDVSPSVTQKSFVFPIVGTSCFLLSLASAQDPFSFTWSVFVVPDRPLALSATSTFSNGLLLLLEAPTTEIVNSSGTVRTYYGGRLMAFNVSMLQQVDLTPGELFSTWPAYTIARVLSFQIVNDLLITSGFQNPDQNMPVTSYFVPDGKLWDSCSFVVSPDTVNNLASLQLFTYYLSSLITWVCVGAGTMWCVVVASNEITPVQFDIPYNMGFGPPSIAVGLSLVWAVEGSLPFSVSLNYSDMAYSLDWMGISNSRPSFGYPINQTSCSDAVLARDGLFLLCAAISETKKRLYLVDAQTGALLYGGGPEVQAGSLQVSANGQYLTYFDSEFHTVFTATLSTTRAPASVGLSATVCISSGTTAADATYVLTVSDQGISATKTPHSALENVSHSTYEGISLFTDNAFASTNNLAIDTLVYISNSMEMIMALNASLYPPLSTYLFQDGVYIAAAVPARLSSASGEFLYMSEQQCTDCYMSWCPTFCTLDVVTGEQHIYEGEMTSIIDTVKSLGETIFGGSVTTTQITYSGDVNLNLWRFAAQLPVTQQLITCLTDSNSATSLAPSGRQCLVSEQGLSVIELVAGGPSLFTFYKTNNLASLATMATRAKYHAFSAWNMLSVLLVEGQLGLAPFLTSNLDVLPTFTPTGSLIIYISSSNLTEVGLTLATDDGSLLVYTFEACINATTVNEALPMCPLVSSIGFDRGMIDEGLATVAWQGLDGSNWGRGFVAVGYRVWLRGILRELKSDLRSQAVLCQMLGNNNPLCEAVCQPTADCASQLSFAFASYLSINSWLPSGSTLTAGGPCNFRSGTILDFAVKFYGTKDGEAIATTDINGSEVLMFSSGTYSAGTFGASFTFSRCMFFTLSNVVAQPFGWLAICAVKSLLVTFAFYLAEHWVRGRERQRNAVRDRTARLAAEASEEAIPAPGHTQTAGCREAELLLPPAPGGIDCQPPSEQGMRLRHSSQTTADQATSESRCLAAQEKHHHRTSRSIVDRLVALAARLCSYKHPFERAGEERIIRDNMLPKHLDEDSLVELLLFVLKEDRRNADWVRAFACYYELNMCRGSTWVVRQQSHERKESQRLAATMHEQLMTVHAALREVYGIFKATSAAYSTLEIGLKPTMSTPLLADKQNGLPPCPAASQSQAHSPYDGLSGELVLKEKVNTFNALHLTEPACFEYALMSARQIDEQLQPSAPLLGLSLLQSTLTVIVYAIDVHLRSLATPLTALQMYECVCFMVFNSSLPSSLLVSAVFHADLSPSMQATSAIGWLVHVIKSPFMLASIVLLSAPLATHVIPGLLLYCWVLVPPIAVAVLIERWLRLNARRPSRLLLASRVMSRIAILLTTSIAFSVAFNVADGYFWKSVKGEEPFTTGSYVKKGYLSSLEQDYNDRSLACVWEHLFSTISNFLQMGFFLV